MEFDPERNQESLLLSAAQEKTSLRTHYLLVASRLVFAFAHGAFLVAASATVGVGSGASWWTVFMPVWLGDFACMALIVYSWFASCPYIKLCLREHQARVGDPGSTSNPSILTELFPELVMTIFGLIFVVLALVGELMLCGYLDSTWRGESHSLVPSAVVFFFVAALAGCRGVCITTHADYFGVLGLGTMATIVAALCEPRWPSGEGGWLLAIPPALTAAALLVASAIRLRQTSCVLSKKERSLRYLEEVVLVVVLLALALLAWTLAQHPRPGASTEAALAGVVAGGGVCTIAALRAAMALVESRTILVSTRLQTWQALSVVSAPDGPARGVRLNGQAN